MHKKLAADLTSLAHSILQMKNKDEVFALREKLMNFMRSYRFLPM